MDQVVFELVLEFDKVNEMMMILTMNNWVALVDAKHLYEQKMKVFFHVS